MPWIENTSYNNIANGCHSYEKDNTVLIQILSPGVAFPKSKFDFVETRQYEFDDVEIASCGLIPISIEIAESIVELLLSAKANNHNVLVHCAAGISRSGAVAEVGCMLGFDDRKNPRTPNRRVKEMLMMVLDPVF